MNDTNLYHYNAVCAGFIFCFYTNTNPCHFKEKWTVSIFFCFCAIVNLRCCVLCSVFMLSFALSGILIICFELLFEIFSFRNLTWRLYWTKSLLIKNGLHRVLNCSWFMLLIIFFVYMQLNFIPVWYNFKHLIDIDNTIAIMTNFLIHSSYSGKVHTFFFYKK